MGYIAHDAVVVTIYGYVLTQSGSPVMPDVEAFRDSLPEEWRPLVVGPVKGLVNDFLTYVFLPDGSKEGWDTSDEGDAYRERFAALFGFRYDDGSSPFDVVHVRFGGDDWREPSVRLDASALAAPSSTGTEETR